jgi:hypothetical protein
MGHKLDVLAYNLKYIYPETYFYQERNTVLHAFTPILKRNSLPRDWTLKLRSIFDMCPSKKNYPHKNM